MSRLVAEVPLSYSDLVPDGATEKEDELFGDAIPIRTWSRGKGLFGLSRNSFDGSDSGVVIGMDSIATEGSESNNASFNSAGDQSLLHYFASQNEGGDEDDGAGAGPIASSVEAEAETEVAAAIINGRAKKTELQTNKTTTTTSTTVNKNGQKIINEISVDDGSYDNDMLDQKDDDHHHNENDNDNGDLFDEDGDDSGDDGDNAFGLDFCITGKAISKSGGACVKKVGVGVAAAVATVAAAIPTNKTVGHALAFLNDENNNNNNTTTNNNTTNNARLCLSISDFHPESWSPTWNVGSILTGVVSFMNSEEITTGGLKDSPEVCYHRY